MPRFSRPSKSTIRRGIPLFVLMALFSALHLGCGAGCSCARRETADTENAPVKTEPAVTPATAASPALKKQPTAIDLVAIGRDVELGRYSDALQKLKGRTRESDKTRYLAALAMQAQKRYTDVVKVLSGQIDYTHSELQFRAAMLRIDALFALKQHENAVAEINTLLQNNHLQNSERRELLDQLGDGQLALGACADAAASYRLARKWSAPARAEQLTVKTARALLCDNQTTEAARLLGPLALSSSHKAVMNDAFTLLKTHHLLPKWGTDEQLQRIDQLMHNKSWDEAGEGIASLQASAGPATRKELRWKRAQLLFKRRGHYKEAITALALVVKDGPPHAEEAGFLSARALARLDRDKEAIAAFLAFAPTAKNKKRADEARFQAARLAYYLGRHAAALKDFKSLVGNGRQTRRSSLDGGTVRDAFFLAGMSAFLLSRFGEAEDLFNAASVGSNSAEAIERNRYWAAVSVFNQKKDDGKRALERICQDNATSWYALFAGIRLSDAGIASDICQIVLPPLTANQNEPPDTAALTGADVSSSQPADAPPPLTPVVSLAQISSKANLYATMGLYRPAAEALHQVEKGGRSTASKQDFILHYLQLDAPQYAIRNASNGLKWEKRDADFNWLARTAYPVPYRSLVEDQNSRHGLPPYLIYAIARKESLFDPFALSWVGAMGMMQMMPQTYENNRKRAGLPRLAKGALPSPAESIVAGGFELAHLLEKFNGSLPLAIMAYNGGSAGVDRWLERSGEFTTDVFVEKAGFAQTRNYVRRVYQNLVRYCLLYNAPLPSLPRQALPSTSKTAIN